MKELKVEEFRDKLFNGEHINFTEDRAVLHIALRKVSNNPICDNGVNVVPEYYRSIETYSKPGLKKHFLSNIDGTHFAEVLKKLNLEITIFIIASKTFTTKKILLMQIPQRNGSLNVKKIVTEFGINLANMFKFWDWRYSLWSGSSLYLSLGSSLYLSLGSTSSSVQERKRGGYETTSVK
ncbi:hypothetical protein Glove_11g67 [Diversispora epigaea]|uniref:Glucose-6-phosphate isomerase n=1 Tax=Diversispora epigaea TaxID=1348612 RepID=A0A397JN07_9GLOM|nr:hypothetical protein Glove_11g67 [Diversispora epigaea]